MRREKVAEKLIELAQLLSGKGRKIRSGSNELNKMLYELERDSKELQKKILEIRSELRDEGKEAEADMFFLDATRILSDFKRLLKKIAK